jgi:8-oxo-dGDP phosphatase
MSDFGALRERMLTEPIADIPEHADVLDTEVAFQGRVWNIRTDRVRLGEAEFVRDYVDHTGAVAVAALDDDGRLLLINQYRHPIRSRDWELPAGLLDVAGEDPLAAAQRELAEEADLQAEEWEPLVRFASSPGGSDETLTLFVARGLSPVDSGFRRTDEEAEIVPRWVPLDEVVAAILDGRLHNGTLQVGALALAARLRA